MWAFTSFGLLMPAIRPPHTVPKDDDRNLQVRARRAKDLDILRALYMQGTLGPTIHTPDKDYEYRAYCTHLDFANAMWHMTMAIDYKKFKPTTDRFEDHEYHMALNSIWSTVMSLLSSPRHRHEYWTAGRQKYSTTGRTDGVRHTYHSTVRPAAELPSGVTGDDWSAGDLGAARFSDTGWPVADFDLPRADWVDKSASDWAEKTTAEIDAILAQYDTEHPASDDLPALPEPGTAIGLAWAEIDDLLDSLDRPMDHSTCAHGNSRTVKMRCLRAYRRDTEQRVDELRAAISEYEATTGQTTGVPAA